MANIGQNFDQKEILELLKKQNGAASIPQQGAKVNNNDASLFADKAAFGSLTKTGNATGLEAGLQTKVAAAPAQAQEVQTPQNGQSIFGGKAAGGSVDGSIFASSAPKAKSADEVLGENDWGAVGLSFSGSQPQQIQDSAQGGSIIDKVKSLFAGIGSDVSVQDKNSTKGATQQQAPQQMSNKQKLAAGKAANSKGQQEIKENKKNQGQTKLDTQNMNQNTNSAEMDGMSAEAKVNSDDSKAKQAAKNGKNITNLTSSASNTQSAKPVNTKGASASAAKVSSGTTTAAGAGKSAMSSGNRIKSDDADVKNNNSQNITSMSAEASSYMNANNTDEAEKTSVEKSFEGMEKTAQGNGEANDTISENNGQNKETEQNINTKFDGADKLMDQSDIKKLLATNNKSQGDKMTKASADSKAKSDEEKDSSDAAKVAGDGAKGLATSLGSESVYRFGEAKVCGAIAKGQRTEATAMRTSAQTLRTQAQASRTSAATMHAAANGDQAAAASLQATGKSLIAEGKALQSNPYTASLGAAMEAAGHSCNTTGKSQDVAAKQLHTAATKLETAAGKAETEAGTLDTKAGETDTKAGANETTSKQKIIDGKSLARSSAMSMASATASYATSQQEKTASDNDNQLSEQQKASANQYVAAYKTNLSQSLGLSASAEQMRGDAENSQNILGNNVSNSKACAARVSDSNEDNIEKAEKLLAQVKQGDKTDKDATSSEDAEAQDAIGEGSGTKVAGGNGGVNSSNGQNKQGADKASANKNAKVKKDDKKVNDKKDKDVKNDEKSKETKEEPKEEIKERTDNNDKKQEEQKNPEAAAKISAPEVKANNEAKVSADDIALKKIQI